MSGFWSIRSSIRLLAGAWLAVAVGCGGEPQTFPANRLAAEIQAQENGVPMEQAVEDVEAILVELFGTLNEPKFPQIEGLQSAGLVDSERLKRAAGPVYSDRDDVHFGLFREHCVACHGLSGTGRGPAAALQNPYPRDFTAGVFKYKSTERGQKPTRDDLMRTLFWGLPGTSMPAFGLVDEADLEAIVDYVIYLSSRGEMERRLLAIAARDLNYEADGDGEQRWLRPDVWGTVEGELAEQVAEQRSWIEEELSKVLGAWTGADQSVAEVQPVVQPVEPTGDRGEWLAAGREIFHGQIANCASCHGENGAGLAKLPPDYDEWTKEWSVRMGIDPKNREKLAPYFAAGALKPKEIQPRNLQNGVFRGGRDRADVYRRIVHGIEGTPMPAVSRVDAGEGSVPSGAGLSEQQIWQLVDYVLSLGPGRGTEPGSGELAESTQPTF